MLQIEESQGGGEVEVGLGESFELRLPENPTTGYRWEVRSPGKPAVEIEKDSFQGAGGPPGAGGHHCWFFRAAQPGVAHLELDYRRGWEKSQSRTFRVTVRVKGR
jgi:inhibitor of cysteine peptidase